MWEKQARIDDWDITWNSSDPLTWNDMEVDWTGITREGRDKVDFTKVNKPDDGWVKA